MTPPKNSNICCFGGLEYALSVLGFQVGLERSRLTCWGLIENTKLCIQFKYEIWHICDYIQGNKQAIT